MVLRPISGAGRIIQIPVGPLTYHGMPGQVYSTGKDNSLVWEPENRRGRSLFILRKDGLFYNARKRAAGIPEDDATQFGLHIFMFFLEAGRNGFLSEMPEQVSDYVFMGSSFPPEYESPIDEASELLSDYDYRNGVGFMGATDILDKTYFVFVYDNGKNEIFRALKTTDFEHISLERHRPGTGIDLYRKKRESSFSRGQHMAWSLEGQQLPETTADTLERMYIIYRQERAKSGEDPRAA